MNYEMMDLVIEERVITLFNELAEALDGDLGAVADRYRATHGDKPAVESEIAIALTAAKKEAQFLSQAKQSVPDLWNDFYWGVCPECHCIDGYVNVNRSDFMLCARHHVAWHLGWNFFSTRCRTVEEGVGHLLLLEQKYRLIEAWFPPAEWIKAETRKRRETQGVTPQAIESEERREGALCRLTGMVRDAIEEAKDGGALTPGGVADLVLRHLDPTLARDAALATLARIASEQLYPRF
jgi:hypothetical protein